MLIVCPSCATSYQIDPSALGATGRSVRCVRCKKMWFASNTAALADIARAHREDVQALTAESRVGNLAEAAPSADPPAPTASMEAAPLPESPLAMAAEPLPIEPPYRDDRGPAPLADAAPAFERALAVTDAPEPAPPASPPSPVAAPINVELAAARRTRRPAGLSRKSRWPVPSLSTAILLLIVANTGLIAFRAEIARLLPQTASLYAAIGLPINLRGLVFAELVTRKETQDGVPMLVVEGAITSTSRRAVEVPRIRFSVRNAAGQEIYSWTALPTRNALAPGARLPFRSRLASPPAEAHEVLVRFFTRRDLLADVPARALAARGT